MCHYLAGPIHGISVVAECIECKLDLTKEDGKGYEAPIEQWIVLKWCHGFWQKRITLQNAYSKFGHSISLSRVKLYFHLWELHVQFLWRSQWGHGLSSTKRNIYFYLFINFHYSSIFLILGLPMELDPCCKFCGGASIEGPKFGFIDWLSLILPSIYVFIPFSKRLMVVYLHLYQIISVGGLLLLKVFKAPI